MRSSPSWRGEVGRLVLDVRTRRTTTPVPASLPRRGSEGRAANSQLSQQARNELGRDHQGGYHGGAYPEDHHGRAAPGGTGSGAAIELPQAGQQQERRHAHEPLTNGLQGDPEAREARRGGEAE